MSQHSRHNDPGAPPVNLGLIITPMLDMSFQILSFFIMTYNPSILEGHINGNLVPPTNPLIKGKEKNTPTDKTDLLPDSEPDLEDTLQVIVKAIPKGGVERKRTDGEPAQIYVKKKEDTDMSLVADTDDDTIEASLAKLKKKLQSTATAGVKNNIRLECQGDLKHQYVMQLYDTCKTAGYQNVSFVAPAPERKEK